MSERIDFKIISNKNRNVYCEGYVDINDREAEDVDWHYWTGNGYQSSQFYHHDQEEITGLTTEQNDEIDKFKEDYMEDALWIDTTILQSDEDENRTHVRENCTLIINEGAKIEMKEIIVKLTEIRDSITCVVDEHPIVNDPDYVDVVTVPTEIHYEYDGCKHMMTGESKEDIISKIIPQVIFDTWFEENWMKTFKDYGIEAPVVYDYEEDSRYAVESIDNFVNNCKTDECYKEFIQKLQEIAEKEYYINIIDKT